MGNISKLLTYDNYKKAGKPKESLNLWKDRILKEA